MRKNRKILYNQPVLSRTSGFTLIELSIVLVILGLIVGGIVGGNSLIKAAQLQNVIREFNGYTTAYNAFRMQFDAIPGDFNEGYDYFSGGSNDICGTDGGNNHSNCNGNGDGIIGNPSLGIETREGVRAWLHLQLAEIIQGKVAPYQTGGRYDRPDPGASHSNAVFHYNVPTSKLGQGAGWLFVSYGSQGTMWGANTGWYGKSGNWLQLGAYVPGGWWWLDGAALTQREASSIDKKIDDGFPTLGKVAAMNGSTGNDVNNAASPACLAGGGVSYSSRNTAPLSTSVTYNLAGNNLSCTMHFYLD